MHERDMRLDLDGPRDAVVRFLHPVRLSTEFIFTQVSLPQSNESKGVVWILIQCLIEQVRGLVDVVLVLVALQVAASLQVEGVSAE